MGAQKNNAYAEESAEVEVLYADLEKLNALTKKIQGSLSRLETSGNVVKDAIGPIYGNTQALQVTNSNIDKVNDAIERIRRPLDVKGQEESIIRAGYEAIFRPERSGGNQIILTVIPDFYRPLNAGLFQFLGALSRVDHALTDLTSTNIRSNQKAVSEFSSLLNTGTGKLHDFYRSILRENVTPIEPLHYLTKRRFCT